MNWYRIVSTLFFLLIFHPLPFKQSLLSGYSPAELIQCLCELTHETREIVQVDTDNIDLNRDAKLLR